ncbi:hypothetical protein KTR10_00325 [Candidatus Kaiserbacteria bacterium]|nr:hypothetical protein [Candidatus Kaiserbacteria bacterium]
MAEVIGYHVKEIDFHTLWWYTDIAVAVLTDEHNRERSGGVFHLRTAAGTELYNKLFRDVLEEKEEKYHRIAAEKTARLAQHTGHILSWESRNEALEQYQGGVRAPNGLIGSFSGFTAEEDEVIVLWAFNKMGWMSDEEVLEAVSISSNTRYRDLFPLFNKVAKTAD